MQSVHIQYSGSATREYIAAIREHVVQPLENTRISDHCFATAMLIFAGIDGLGRLVHPNPDAGAGERFKGFLPRLGIEYQMRENEIWDLRNSLDHNAINVACYMSKTEDARGEHLEVDNGHLFLHIVRLLADFRTSLNTLEAELQRDVKLFERTELRLEWACLDLPGWRGQNVQTTPPPIVRFVYPRQRNKKSS